MFPPICTHFAPPLAISTIVSPAFARVKSSVVKPSTFPASMTISPPPSVSKRITFSPTNPAAGAGRTRVSPDPPDVSSSSFALALNDPASPGSADAAGLSYSLAAAAVASAAA